MKSLFYLKIDSYATRNTCDKLGTVPFSFQQIKFILCDIEVEFMGNPVGIVVYIIKISDIFSKRKIMM